MADTIRRVTYYYTTIPDKPGEGTRLLETLRSAGVNLLALHAFPSARKAQVDFVPSDASVFTAAAKGAKIKLSKPKTAFLIDGDDRVGALAGILARLGSAKINVTAVTGVCAGMGRYGAILWVKPAAVNKAAAALGAM
jgi:prephenate dehydratase